MISDIRIGVVGLGNMGLALATRLQQLVSEVVVFDVLPEAMRAAVACGARAATSAREVGELSDIVVASLPSPQIALEVAQEVGVNLHLKAYVETSTIGPMAVQEIASSMTVPVVDAPLSGGPKGILQGNLTSYISGSPDILREIAPWFEALCTKRIIVGEQPGAAQIAKVVNNAVSLSGMAIACEAIAVGVAAGIEPKTVVEAVNSGTGQNSATKEKIPQSVLTGTFDFGGPVYLAEKDLELYQSLAQRAGLENSLVDSALESYREAILRFGGNADYTEIARVFESAVGMEIRDRTTAINSHSSVNAWRSEYLD